MFAGRVLCQARRVLKYTLVEFYFLDEDTQFGDFFQQTTEILMEQTERLSFVLQRITKEDETVTAIEKEMHQCKSEVKSLTDSLLKLCNTVTTHKLSM